MQCNSNGLDTATIWLDDVNIYILGASIPQVTCEVVKFALDEMFQYHQCPLKALAFTVEIQAI